MVIGLAEQDNTYIDVTEEWLKFINNSKKGVITWGQYFDFEGVRYDTTNAVVKNDPNAHEQHIATWICKTFHEDIEFVPRIIGKKERISTPDFIFKKEKWELKSIEGNSKRTIENRVKDAKKQANNFIIDLSKSKMTTSDGIVYCQMLYSKHDTRFIEKLMLIKNDELICILEKKR